MLILDSNSSRNFQPLLNSFLVKITAKMFFLCLIVRADGKTILILTQLSRQIPRPPINLYCYTRILKHNWQTSFVNCESVLFDAQNSKSNFAFHCTHVILRTNAYLRHCKQDIALTFCNVCIRLSNRPAISGSHICCLTNFSFAFQRKKLHTDFKAKIERDCSFIYICFIL